jgi:hypothetical protein
MAAPIDRHSVRDVVTINQEILQASYPLPPLNCQCFSSFIVGSFDIRWTNPAMLCENTNFNAIGVNVYRSFDSEFGPFVRLTPVPIGTTFFRDKTEVAVALQESVSSFVARGNSTDVDGRYIFRVKNKPIFVERYPGITDCENLSVFVTVNGIQAPIKGIDQENGMIELVNTYTYDVTNQTRIPPVVPTQDSDVVLCSYKYIKNLVKSDLDARIFYRITTVAVDKTTGQLIETPLERAAQTHNKEVEKLDWIWREAVRRNSWILDQGGERVKIFIKKLVGQPCGCSSDYYKQGKTGCLKCFETRILGGFDGPFDAIISPDDGERNVAQTNRGRRVDHSYDTWTGPNPVLSQRDFLVKLNGDRFAVGPVRVPSNRGMQLQQFFRISSLDEADVRFKVPVLDPFTIPYPQTRPIVPWLGNSTPMMTERNEIPDGREIRSNTVTGGNHLY